MKQPWGAWLAIFAVLFFCTHAQSETPARPNALNIQFGPWMPVSVRAITKEGPASIDGQQAVVKLTPKAVGEPSTVPFVCWRDARSGILCFGPESRFYVCLDDRVIGLPQVFEGRSTCIEVFQRKIALEDLTKERDQLQSMEELSACSFLNYKEALIVETLWGSDFFNPTMPSQLKMTTIDQVTLAGEEMTLQLTNPVQKKAEVTFSTRTLKLVKARMDGAK